MTIAKTDVVIEVQGEQKAAADAKLVQREVDAITRKAATAEAAAGRAIGLKGRLDSLLLRARASGMLKRNGLELGPLELNRSGFGVNPGFLRGSGMGTAAGALAVAHIAGATLNQGADLYDGIKELLHQGATVDQVIDHVGKRFARGVFDFFAASSLLRGGLRVAGYRPEQVDQAFDDAFATELGRRAEARAERAEREQRAALRNQIQQTQKDAMADIDARRREVLVAIDAATERELEGVKNESLPIGMNRAMARVYRARREAEVGQRAARARRDAEAITRERKLQVGEGD